MDAPLAEIAWNLRTIRRVRVEMVVWCVFRGIVFLAAALLLPGWWRLLAVLFAAHFAVRLWTTYLMFRTDPPMRLQVHETGLHLDTERSEAFFGWDEVEGFTGVVQRRPLPTAPRTTTGSLSRSPTLRAGGQAIPLGSPSSGDVAEVTRLIEERLLARDS